MHNMFTQNLDTQRKGMLSLEIGVLLMLLTASSYAVYSSGMEKSTRLILTRPSLSIIMAQLNIGVPQGWALAPLYSVYKFSLGPFMWSFILCRQLAADRTCRSHESKWSNSLSLVFIGLCKNLQVRPGCVWVFPASFGHILSSGGVLQGPFETVVCL